MTKQATFYIKPGDDINWRGTITRAGVTSFVGYTLKAQFRAKSKKACDAGTLLDTGVCTWISAAAGTFSLRVARANTLKWPENITVMLDISILDPDGKRVRSETAELKTITGVTETV